MSFILFLLFFYFLFKVIGGIVSNFLLNSGAYKKNYGDDKRGQFQSDFQRIFQEMFNNLNQGRNQSSYRENHSQNNNQRQNNQEQFNRRPSGINSSMSKDEACEILGVQSSSTVSEVKTAYKKLMMQHHPDKGGSKYFAQKINEAKKVLTNE